MMQRRRRRSDPRSPGMAEWTGSRRPRARFPAYLSLPCLSLALIAVFACSPAPPPGPAAEEKPAETSSSRTVLREPISPLPDPPSLDPAKVALGRRLYHDPSLSSDGRTSCAGCHPLDRAGVDGERLSVTGDGTESLFNAPTTFNASFLFRQFWDGRAVTLEEQLDEVREHELKIRWNQLLARVTENEGYLAAFQELYPEGVNRESFTDAMVTFERTLVTPNSAFDRYLKGEGGAISSEALAGYSLFKRHGCITCHQGVAVGGNLYQRFGHFGDFFADRGTTNEADLGRFRITGDERDRHVFKVPSLRNVALTAPYFHDGSVSTLHEAVSLMARYQTGTDVDDEEVDLLVAFLDSLTGEYQGRPLSLVD